MYFLFEADFGMFAVEARDEREAILEAYGICVDCECEEPPEYLGETTLYDIDAMYLDVY